LAENGGILAHSPVADHLPYAARGAAHNDASHRGQQPAV